MNIKLALLLVIGIFTLALIKQTWTNYQLRKSKGPLVQLERGFAKLRVEEEAAAIRTKDNLDELAARTLVYHFGLVLVEAVKRVQAMETVAGKGEMFPYYTTTFTVPGEGEWAVRVERYRGNASQQGKKQEGDQQEHP